MSPPRAPRPGPLDEPRPPARKALTLGGRMGLILVAVGGNALIRPGQIGSAAEQLENARLTARDLLRLLEGQFPPGSMGPKVESAAEFVERTGREAVITDLASLVGAAGGSAGTRVAAA